MDRLPEDVVCVVCASRDGRFGGFDIQREEIYFFLLKMNRPRLNFAQPPDRWLPGFLSVAVKWLGPILTNHHSLVPRLNMNRYSLLILSMCAFVAMVSVC